jgi:hypothetical protein
MFEETDRTANVDSQRRRLLAGLAASGVGLAGLDTASALDVEPAADGTTASSHGLYFDGFRQVETGSADLYVDNGELVVSDFDGGLDDGTCVPVNAAEGFRTRTTFDPDEPYGSIRRFLTRGYIDGQDGNRFGFVDVERTGWPDGYLVQPDFSAVDAEGYAVELYDGDELVYEGGPFADPTQIIFDGESTDTPSAAQASGTPPDHASTDSVGTSSHGSNTILAWWQWVWTGSSFRLALRIQTYVYFETPDGTITFANRMRLFPWNPINTGPFSECDAFGANWNSFRIFRYSALAFDRWHRQQGRSWLWPQAFNGELEIRNVGSSGDGVTTSLDFVNGFKQVLDGIDFSTSGATVTASAHGDWSGNSFAPVGWGSLTDDGSGGVSVQADFADINANYVRVEVYDGGNFVADSVESAGDVADLGFQPALDEAGYLSGSDPGVCFKFGSTGTITAESLSFSVQGDEILLRAYDNNDPVSSVSEFTLEAGNVNGSFTVTDEYLL